MKKFNGFPEKNTFTPIPNIFFSSILSEIDDMQELKLTLCIFSLLYPKKGYPKFITFTELLNNPVVIHCFPENSAQMIREALQRAIERGTLIGIQLEDDQSGTVDDIFFLNTQRNQEIRERITNGEFKLSGFRRTGAIPIPVPEKEPEIFTMYEENIGLLTPMIAEELKEAEKIYPAEWLKDAIKEAVSLNRRNWRYIQRILERWSVEGKQDGTHRRHTKENTDPDKYIKGKYGHIVQR